jgi:small subunit ribosomal protein S20
MPITSSAKKAIRVSARKKLVNDRRTRTMKDEVKKLEKAVKAGKKEDAAKMISVAFAAVDKAAKRGVIKKNTASRKKARLSRLIK